MAKATAAATANRSWTLDDLPAINSEVEALGQTVQHVNEIVASFNDRLTAAEKITANIDAGERQLPSEIIAGLNPGQVFATALSASVQAVIANHPTFASMQDNVKRKLMRDAVIAAEHVLAVLLERMPAKKTK